MSRLVLDLSFNNITIFSHESMYLNGLNVSHNNMVSVSRASFNASPFWVDFSHNRFGPRISLLTQHLL